MIPPMADAARDGVVQYTCALIPGCSPTEREGRDLSLWRRQLFALDVIGCDMSRYGACYGNVSVRTGAWAAPAGRREFLVSCTQTGGDPDAGPTSLARVIQYDHDRNHVVAVGACPPSSEAMTHGAMYDASLDVRAIVHGHAPGLWRWLLANHAPTTPKQVDYGTPEMAAAARAIVRGSEHTPWTYPGVLAMAGHEDGVVAWGASPKHATQRFLSVYEAALAALAVST